MKIYSVYFYYSPLGLNRIDYLTVQQVIPPISSDFESSSFLATMESFDFIFIMILSLFLKNLNIIETEKKNNRIIKLKFEVIPDEN